MILGKDDIPEVTEILESLKELMARLKEYPLSQTEKEKVISIICE